jgi:hypothetical protein
MTQRVQRKGLVVRGGFEVTCSCDDPERFPRSPGRPPPGCDEYLKRREEERREEERRAAEPEDFTPVLRMGGPLALYGAAGLAHWVRETDGLSMSACGLDQWENKLYDEPPPGTPICPECDRVETERLASLAAWKRARELGQLRAPDTRR